MLSWDFWTINFWWVSKLPLDCLTAGLRAHGRKILSSVCPEGSPKPITWYYFQSQVHPGKLVVGWTNPFEKYSSNWKSSPIFGVKINKYLKTTTWKTNGWKANIGALEDVFVLCPFSLGWFLYNTLIFRGGLQKILSLLLYFPLLLGGRTMPKSTPRNLV